MGEIIAATCFDFGHYQFCVAQKDQKFTPEEYTDKKEARMQAFCLKNMRNEVLNEQIC